MNIVEVKISDIKIGERFRKDLGDLEGLAQSINEGELLQAIGITPESELVLGERRLRACRDVLGRETIMARIVDVRSMLLGQIEENALRKDFTLTEQVAIVDSLRTFQHGGDRRSDQAGNSQLGSLTLPAACKRVGLSEDAYRNAKIVIERGVPELADAMDSKRLSIHAAHTLAQATPEEQEIVLTKQLEKATSRNIDKQLRKLRNQAKFKNLLTAVIEAPKKDDDIQIHHCPFQNLEQVAGIEPDSVKLICTDIPYTNDFIQEIKELAAVAERVLVPGGTFVSYLGHFRLDEKLAELSCSLKYQWMGTSVWNGPGNMLPNLKIISKSHPIVVYSKGKWNPPHQWVDTLMHKDREKEWHPWQRPLPEIEKLVCYFSKPGDLVVDPCGGGFTTAIACLKNHRRFIGCDIEQAAVAKGQERLAQERRPQRVITIDQPADFKPLASCG